MKVKKVKFAMSYSFGKDSALALWRMIKAGHEPVCLIVAVNEQADRSWFHGVDNALMNKISDSLEIPLLKCLCNGDNYQTELEKHLMQAYHIGAEACVFGDIDIEDHLYWNRQRCITANMECIMPLWKAKREDIVYEMIDSGFQAVIKCVQLAYLDDSFLGLTITREVVERIRATGADICGENGEYHTLVYDVPTFKSPVDINLGQIIDFGSHSAIDITNRNSV